MRKFNYEENVMIRAEVAYKMRNCTNEASKVLLAYILLNTYSDKPQQNIYAQVLEEHLSETDYQKVIAETAYGKFDNTSFWIDKIIQDIEDYCTYSSGYEKKKFMEDAVKGAFGYFVYFTAQLSEKAANELVDAVLASTTLEFLKPLAFFTRQYIEDAIPDLDLTEEERYLDLLKKEFYPYEIFADIEYSDADRVRDYALKQKKRKSSETNGIATQMSFLHLLENKK